MKPPVSGKTTQTVCVVFARENEKPTKVNDLPIGLFSREYRQLRPQVSFALLLIYGTPRGHATDARVSVLSLCTDTCFIDTWTKADILMAKKRCFTSTVSVTSLNHGNYN